MHDKLTTDAQNPLARRPATASEIAGPMGAVAAGAPWDTQPFSIKRDSINIINCDAEPVRVRAPSCIQAHGALLVLRLSDFSILQASENTQAILGQDPAELFNKSVAAVVKNEGEIRLRSILATEPTDRNPIYAFTLPANGPIAALDVTLHTIDGGAVLEFEATGRSQSDTDSGHIAPNPCQQLDYYAIHLLSGLDRVMVYKFHAHHHGEVFAESRRSDLAPWLGLHYPAADSPQQARELLAKTWIRPTPAVQGGLAGLNADLARSNDGLDAFAYMASHDLKEPLRGVHKYAHQPIQAVPASEDNKRKLDGLMRLSLRMDNLLDSLLHFSRVGREELTLEKVDPNHMLADAIEMVGSRTEDSHTQITRPRPLPFIMCDHVRVREVLVNLLSNALKHNDKPAKRLEVGFIHTHESALRQGFPDSIAGQTVHYVCDNGIGTAPRYFDQVFKMFKRLYGREEYGGGTGAGPDDCARAGGAPLRSGLAGVYRRRGQHLFLYAECSR